MQQEERLAIIKKWLEQTSQLRTRQIMKRFGISFDTARRDVVRLTQTGQALRVHGGIMALNQNGVPSFASRNRIESPLKAKMAKILAHYIYPGGLYFFGPSTTIARACRDIVGINTTIMTNSIDNAAILTASNLPHVELLGGKVNKENRFTYSMDSLEKVKNYRFRMVVVGAGLIKNGHVYLINAEDAAIDQQAVAEARQVMLIAENYKFHRNNPSSYRFMDCRNVDTLITDQPLDKESRKYFKDNCLIKSVSQSKKS